MCCILLLGMSAGKGLTAEVGPGTDRASDGARLSLELMHDLLGTAETRQTGLVGKDQVQKVILYVCMQMKYLATWIGGFIATVAITSLRTQDFFP
jgi:hypothetical protein